MEENALSFDIVLKITERCNLACPYCYYFNHEYDATKRPPTIRNEVVAALPGFLRRSYDALNLSRINVVFHGGEPLLLKKKRFVEICETLRTVEAEKRSITFAVQTNGTLIDEEWIDIFERFDVKAGISIDGEREAHDRNRPDHQGRGSYDKALAGLRLVESARKAGRVSRSGILAVVDANEDLSRLLDFLIGEIGATSPSLNYPRGGYDEPSAVSWGKSVERIRPLVATWLDKYVFPTPYFIRGLTDVILAMYSDAGIERNSKRHATQHFIATVASDGSLLVDDNIIALDSEFAETHLNIFDHNLRDLVTSELFGRLTRAIDHVPAKCSTCAWFKSCRSGALYNRYSKAAPFENESVLCDVLQMIHEETARFLVQKSIVSLDKLANRLESVPLTSAEFMVNVLKQRKEALPC
ncbi:radical SAM protein [Xanthomonas arboricola]|uniref:radical SAM protein n=1 Tax=Xanthomonas arboricola TaxID=56448 RepID=UPI001E45B49D|nr:radical SAM protein [Xanthomonas arboricola]MCC8472433.1 radical SAM protein [Xanthomonas arboricola]